MPNTFVLITGCSGGGKSTLLAALGSRGYETIPEPGRRIVEAESAGTGQNLPWVDMKAFANSALCMARNDLAASDSRSGFVFFDRGVVDAAVALQFAGGAPYRKTLGVSLHYSKTVFLAPPWPEIFTRDATRKHCFEAASEEFNRLEVALLDLGYDVCTLPKISVEDRANYVLDTLRSL